MLKEDEPDKHDVAYGAQRMAVRTVLRLLVEHASATSPDLRDRIIADVEAYLTRLGPQAELERDFADRARASVRELIRTPGS